MIRIKHRDKLWKRIERKRVAHKRARELIRRIESYGIEWIQHLQNSPKKK